MKIGLVYNWPGAKNSELDLIGRITEVLTSMGHKPCCVDPFGKILNSDGEYIEPRKHVDEQKLDFILNLHYTTPNLLDCTSYFTNWNPIDFIRKHPITGKQPSLEEEIYLAACIQSHDIALSAGSIEVDNHYKALNIFNPIYTETDPPHFYTSCQKIEGINPVNLESPRIFYIGINWESLVESSKGRHVGLLELLDKLNFTNFYGVEKLNGKAIWENFQNYCGELPFDRGHSIVKHANQCGISLVLSSQSHRNAGLVSTRIFQACAARTVIITDDNPFILEHFGESVISIRFSSDAQKNLQQIAEAYQWICANPDSARQKAEAAYQLFIERYTLETQVAKLLNWHQKYQPKPVATNASPIKLEIFWIARCCSTSDIDLFVNSLNRQTQPNIKANIFVALENAEHLEKMLGTSARFSWHITPLKTLHRIDGHYIAKGLNHENNDGYFCIYQNQCEWLSMHLFWLVLAAEKSQASAAQSSLCIQNANWESDCTNSLVENISQPFNKPLLAEDLISVNLDEFLTPGFLFRKSCVTAELLAIISQLGHGLWFALVAVGFEQDGQLPTFVPRYTLRFKRRDNLTVLTANEQKAAICYDRRTLKLHFRHSRRLRLLSATSTNVLQVNDAKTPPDANEKLPVKIYWMVRKKAAQYPLLRTIYRRVRYRQP